MKLYRVYVKQENGMYSPGFYHEDKEFMLKAVAHTAEQYLGKQFEYYLEETDINLEKLDLQGVNDGIESTQGSPIGNQDQNSTGPEQSGTTGGNTNQSGVSGSQN